MCFINCFLVMLLIFNICISEKIPIKIVDDPMNYEHGNSENNVVDIASITEDSSWLSTVHPTNFTGPEQFRQLVGHCFSWNNSKYRYEFCPFHNVTQHEISSTWNPYKGVLGVWGEWAIRDNKFSEMLLLQGDACEGNTGNRSVQVHLQCEEDVLGHIIEVSEPDRCLYHFTFSTQLVCHTHAMLVYPRLDPQHQHTWDQLFSEHTRGEITDKGLEIGLHHLFQSAGFYLTEELRLNLRSAPKLKHPSAFFSGSPCEMQLQQLMVELKILQEELAKYRKNGDVE